MTGEKGVLERVRKVCLSLPERVALHDDLAMLAHLSQALSRARAVPLAA